VLKSAELPKLYSDQ